MAGMDNRETYFNFNQLIRQNLKNNTIIITIII